MSAYGSDVSCFTVAVCVTEQSVQGVHDDDVCVPEAVRVSGFMVGWLGSCAAECVCLPCLSVLMRLPVPVACKLHPAGCGCECLWK